MALEFGRNAIGHGYRAARPAALRRRPVPARVASPHPHEAGFLALDSTKARERLGWAPRWDLDTSLERIVEWHLAHRDGGDLRALTLAQIEAHG